MGKAEEIQFVNSMIKGLGGKENIVNIASCITRVRVGVKDFDKVDKEFLDGLEFTLKTIFADKVQVVVGPGKSRRFADMLASELGMVATDEEPTSNSSNNEEAGLDWKKNKEDIKSGQTDKVRDALRKVGSIFVPLIPAIVAAGLLNGIAGYFVNEYAAEGIKTMPLFITFLQTIGGALFGYFFIFVGINAAKEFGATPALGGVLGGVIMSSNITIFSKYLGLYDEQVPLNSILMAGKGGIIGLLLAVVLLVFVERTVRRFTPDALDMIVTPLITLLITSAVTIFAIMPLAGYISDGIIALLKFLIMGQGVLAIIGGFVLAMLFLPLVVVGLHQGLIPFYMVQLERYGNIPLYPVLAMAGAGQVGAAFALYLYLRNKSGHDKLKKVITGSLPVGVLGIGEPLIYGVTLPLGRPFLTACVGGGFGGAVCAFTGVASTAFGPSGLTAIPLIVPDKIGLYVVGLITSYVAGFVLTYFFGIPEQLKSNSSE